MWGYIEFKYINLFKKVRLQTFNFSLYTALYTCCLVATSDSKKQGFKIASADRNKYVAVNTRV